MFRCQQNRQMTQILQTLEISMHEILAQEKQIVHTKETWL